MAEPARPYTPETLAERWGCSSAHIRAMIRRGELVHFRLGKLLRISAVEVERYESRDSAGAGSKGGPHGGDDALEE